MVDARNYDKPYDKYATLFDKQLASLLHAYSNINFVHFHSLITLFSETIISLKVRTGADYPIRTTGIGKAGHIARKFASTLSSLGIPASFVHPSEAAHGDLGMFPACCAIFSFSNSGKTNELLRVFDWLDKLHGDQYALFSITQFEDNPLAKRSDISVCYGKVKEICHLGSAPTTSTLVMEAIANVLAVSLAKEIGIEKKDFEARHHGGYLGEIAKKEGET